MPRIPFKKGNKLGKGRPRVLLPEVQRAIEANKNALKVIIMDEVQEKAKLWVQEIIAKGMEEGDVIRFKMLMEMALGKLVEDTPDFPVSDEEKALILEYRRRKELIANGNGTELVKLPE